MLMDNGGYDEFEHHVIGDYGIVKMLHLSTDDMDVDNDAFSACGKSVLRAICGKPNGKKSPMMTATRN